MNKKGLMIAVTSISTSDSLSLFLSFPIPRPYLHDTISDQKTHQQNQSQHKIQKNQINQNRKWDEQHIFISVFRSERSINSERERERNYQLRCIPVTMNAGPGHASRLLHHRWTFLLLGVITAPFSFLLLFFLSAIFRQHSTRSRKQKQIRNPIPIQKSFTNNNTKNQDWIWMLFSIRACSVREKLDRNYQLEPAEASAEIRKKTQIKIIKRRDASEKRKIANKIDYIPR